MKKEDIIENRMVTDTDFRLFQKLFDEAIGLHLSAHKKLLLSGRLGKRVVKLGLSGFHQYYELLAGGTDPEEFQRAIDLITTHETFFFREVHHFDLLRDQIAPHREPGRPLKVWSGACSTGEEPWSIAMVLHDALGETGWELVASDVSQDVLSRAARGLYKMERIEGIPPAYLKAYCLKGMNEYQGMLLIQKFLREKVRFRTVNLLEIPNDMNNFDVVFLRNVIIYFDAPTKERILQSVCQRLRPGGWLLLGHSESLTGMDLPLRQIRPSIFRRHP
ncbi:MAG TPA: protein-glutamate O-methyltransferase CheR [Fibrobacteria bacterium]|nr:protein-glutamate O-methyltransferase CheR [Fibrobacteria bacterium]HOX53244.1 protein-glutamate O-methyltransferase CheR [Fibrobacteria bacterium]